VRERKGWEGEEEIEEANKREQVQYKNGLQRDKKIPFLVKILRKTLSKKEVNMANVNDFCNQDGRHTLSFKTSIAYRAAIDTLLRKQKPIALSTVA
jgi:hypothetical protein